jgi:hypothetical protein
MEYAITLLITEQQLEKIKLFETDTKSFASTLVQILQRGIDELEADYNEKVDVDMFEKSLCNDAKAYNERLKQNGRS